MRDITLRKHKHRHNPRPKAEKEGRKLENVGKLNTSRDDIRLSKEESSE